MSSYNGKYYKPTIVKAMNDYECAVSGLLIKKGDYYLNLAVDDETASRSSAALGYIPTKTVRVAKQIFGFKPMEEILDRTGLFLVEKERKRIERLEKENVSLNKLISSLTSSLAECRKECIILQIDAAEKEPTKSTNIKECKIWLAEIIRQYLHISSAGYQDEMHCLEKTFTADTIACAKKELGIVTVDLRKVRGE